MKQNFSPIVLLALCSSAFAAEPEHHHESMAAHTGVVSLDVFVEGPRLHLLTAVAGTPTMLEYQQSSDGGHTWSAQSPVGVGQPEPNPLHRGMDAQIAAAPDGQHLVAAWTTAGAQDKYGRGPIATACSADGGKTWSAGSNPADDGLSTGHAFLDLAADEHGSFHLVWLDGRDNAAGKGLRYARSDDHGLSWTRNKTLDDKTCECCWNTLVTRPDGKVAVLYRDCGPRDMAIIQSPDAGHTWSEPTTVGTFSWDASVCPHVGGALAYGAAGVSFATVWTGAGDNTGAYLLSSTDDGKTWSAPARLGGDPHAWHTDLAASPNGHIVAVYDARTDTTPAIFATASADNGKTWSTPRRLTAPGVTAANPRVVFTANGFRVFWTDAAKWTSLDLGQ
jgi:photosystem II stability/assembly factor-like uncharacterized protein